MSSSASLTCAALLVTEVNISNGSCIGLTKELAAKLVALIVGYSLITGVMLWRDKKSTDKLNQSRKNYEEMIRQLNDG